MSLFSRNRDDDGVKPGDTFYKVGTYRVDWVVERLFDYPDIPRHARLIDQKSGRTMTVALSVLLDTEAYQRPKI